MTLIIACFVFVASVAFMAARTPTHSGDETTANSTSGSVTTDITSVQETTGRPTETTGTPETTGAPETTGRPETTVPVTTAKPVTDAPTTIAPATDAPTTEIPVTNVPVVTTGPAETTADPAVTTTPPAVTTGPDETTDKPPFDSDPVYPMPASPAAEDSFFDNALFVGDSRTQGIQLYGNIKNATYYADQGLNVMTAMERTFINEGGQTLTIVDAIKRHPEFKKIYICFGVNEYWMKTDAYKADYSVLIDAIKAAAAPDAKIYVYAVFPLADGLAQSAYGLNNEKMAQFNAVSLEIAKERGLYYVDVAEAFQKADGRRYLDDSESWDGIHLNVQGTIKLCNYIRTHT